mmetsp:Transcript_4699/g.12043  ORF Transcript_4699/g.12043 Transcript_4699/m.12043 type:complete len:477 (-) Transcript_4699:238-1668(-)
MADAHPAKKLKVADDAAAETAAILKSDAVSVVLGAQWGDEGKGKLVDILAQDADLVCRCQGGNNAGHTIKVGDATYDFHVVPSGIVSPHCTSVIGNGVVLHLEQFFDELQHNVDIDEKTGAGAMKGWQDRLKVSNRAHIVFDLHQQIDGLREEERQAAADAANGAAAVGSPKKGGKIGTTKRGIGPTYAAKATRSGFRVADLYVDRDAFTHKFSTFVKHYKQRFPQLEVDIPATVVKALELGAKLKPFVVDSVQYVHEALGKKKILVEGANALMLDLDFGTYPYVTSSSTSAGGVSTGLGIPPWHVKQIFGVVKAYSTRVGAGGFPTELSYEEGGLGKKLRDIGHEYGVTTGRPRRCGWLDLHVLKWSTMINGYTSLMITKLDCLDTFEELQVCTAYKLDGKVYQGMPVRADDELPRVEPVFQTLPGWNTPTTACKTYEDLPPNAKAYVQFIADFVKVPVQWIGVGPGRTDTIQCF